MAAVQNAKESKAKAEKKMEADLKGIIDGKANEAPQLEFDEETGTSLSASVNVEL